jgi:hypothetical protein
MPNAFGMWRNYHRNLAAAFLFGKLRENSNAIFVFFPTTNFKIQCLEKCDLGWTGLGGKMDAGGDVARATSKFGLWNSDCGSK